MVTHDVLIAGGGITGLAAAYALTGRGLRPIVLESSGRVGGLIRTDRVEGFTIEAGPDSLLAAKPAAVDLARALGLGGDMLSVRTPGAFVLRGRRLHALPSPSLLGLPLTWRALARYDLLPWHARLRLALEPTVPVRTSEDDESVASFFRRRFGPDTVELIAQPLLGGIHAGDIEQLSMQSLFPRLIELERAGGSVLRAAPRARSGGSPFVALRGGMDTLVAALVRALPSGAVRCGASVARIERTASGWRVHTEDGLAPTDARAIVLAIPAHAAAALLRPLDPVAADLCERVPYVSTGSVALAWPRAAVRHPLAGTGFVVARRHTDVRITACTWVSSKWTDRAPEDHVLLRAFIGGSHDPDVTAAPDDELVAIVRRDLSAVLGIAEPPSLSRVYRWRHAGAQHTVGHLARVEEIEKRLGRLGAITAAGSGFRSVGIPDCVAEAARVGAEIAR